jgi:hypothetical protein
VIESQLMKLWPLNVDDISIASREGARAYDLSFGFGLSLSHGPQCVHFAHVAISA